ncbi:hypothetical protein BVRB_9g212240 [Beta vulgaris subsp. vulgaris]|nr:hypothetical protein BVRB_9g212240 [Beta vulgaris subsp. vulgaris]
MTPFTLLNRNSPFQGGLQPYNYCLAVLKRETHSMCCLNGNKHIH